MSKGSAIVGFLLCFVGGMLLMWGIDRQAGHGGTFDLGAESADATGANAGDATAKVPVSDKDPSWGSASAPVTVVIYSDFQCPFCGRVEGTLEGLKRKYGPAKLRMVWKHYPLPFHKKAVPAHSASESVFQLGGSDAFWKFHKIAFQNTKNLDPSKFEAWAVQAGVDKAKFAAHFKANKGKAKVDADLAAGKPLGVRGTPAFFINGKFLSGARPAAAFEKEIESELKETKKLLAAGTPKGQIYAKRAAANFSKKAKAPEKGKKKEDDKTVWKVKVSKSDPVKGNANALVTIVEFSEFQCPFCSRVLPTTKKIFDTYGDKVRIIFKDNPLPFHKRAVPASMFVHEAKAQKGNDGFWKAHDLLFANQKKLEDEDLWGYAKELGLDVAKVKAAVEGQTHKATIAGYQAQASELNASGTPHFFINGRRLVGAQPFDKFKVIIDEEIKKSAAILKKGVKPSELYAEIIKNGKEPPPPEQKDVGNPPAEAAWKGAKVAKVTIHEFSDFQCPFCGRVNPTMKKIMDEYGDRVKVVWRHKPLPFHKDAPLAHQAAQEAYAQKGNEGFWKFHDKLFAGQKSPGLKRESLDKFAEELGLDAAKFKAALDGETHKKFIDAENEASNKVGVRGTPGFVIQPKGSSKGYFLSGAQPFGKFKKLIDRALKEAK